MIRVAIIVIGCFSLVAAVAADAVANELSLAGMWVSVSAGHRAGDATLENPWPRKLMMIEHNRATGDIRTSSRSLTKGLLAAGYELYDPKFIGKLKGDAAAGKIDILLGHEKVICRSLADTSRAARLRLRSGGPLPELLRMGDWQPPGQQRAEDLGDPQRGPLLDLASATLQGLPDCWWYSDGLDNSGSPHYLFQTFQRLFVIRELRFLDSPADGTIGKRITRIEPGRQFRVEAEFLVPPPAEIEATLTTRSGRSYVIVKPTEQKNIFRSEPQKFGERKTP